MKFSKRLITVGIIIVLFGIGLVYFLSLPENMSVTSLERQTLTSTIRERGTVESPNIYWVSTELTAKIIELPVKLGQFVEKGDLLLKLDTTEIDAQLERERLLRVSTDAEWLRQQENAKRQIAALETQMQPSSVTSSIRTKIQAEIALLETASNPDGDSGEAKFYRAQLDLHDRNIEELTRKKQQAEVIAPISGAIQSINVTIGQAAYTNSDLIKVVGTDDLVVSCEVSSNNITSISKDMTVIIEWENRGRSVTFEGDVLSIGTVSTKMTDTKGLVDVIVKPVFPANMAHPKVGYKVTVSFVHEAASDVIAVPQKAVHNTGDNTVVYVLIGNKLVETSVVLGSLINQSYVVLEGLSEGQLVVSDATEARDAYGKRVAAK